MEYQKICDNINPEYGCRIARELSLIGNDNSPWGFKNAGSTGEKKAAEYIVDEMRKAGLNNVHSNSFEVDAWEFRECNLTYIKCGKRISYPLSAFAGVKGTDGTIINGRVVYAGYGTYEDCRRVSLKNAIALIRVDLSRDYWLGEPVYQLELEGAVAVIVIMEGSQFGNEDNVLNSGDCIARPDIPIVNISKVNGEKLTKDLEEGNVQGSLKADCDLFKGESQNIIGEIPGELKDKYIMLGAHYDGYFRAYLDDAFGIGLILVLAKAILSSGYKPKYTIRIVAHGAEEFGVADSHYDWCIGSWQQITKITPRWSEQVKLFLNVDAVVPDAEEFMVQAAPQLHDFVKKSLSEIKLNINDRWAAGYEIRDVNGPWSDDFSYYISGIPVAICGRGKSQWRSQFYHTDKDSCVTLNQELMKSVAGIYMKLLYDYDVSNQLPININEELIKFYKSIDKKLLENEGLNLNVLQSKKELLEESIRDIALKEDSIIAKINNKLIRTVRALDFDDNIIYRLDEVQKNLRILYRIADCINNQNYERAAEEMLNFAGCEIIKDFENEVYEYWCINALDEKNGKINWARGLVEKPADIRVLYKMIQSRLSEKEIVREINTLKDIEAEKGRKHIEAITEGMIEIMDIANRR